MSEAELRVTIRHVRAAKLCTSGAREWFRRHDLDWNAFLRDGLPVTTLEALHDAMADKAIAEARREASR